MPVEDIVNPTASAKDGTSNLFLSGEDAMVTPTGTQKKPSWKTKPAALQDSTQKAKPFHPGLAAIQEVPLAVGVMPNIPEADIKRDTDIVGLPPVKTPRLCIGTLKIDGSEIYMQARAGARKTGDLMDRTVVFVSASGPNQYTPEGISFKDGFDCDARFRGEENVYRAAGSKDKINQLWRSFLYQICVQRCPETSTILTARMTATKATRDRDVKFPFMSWPQTSYMASGAKDEDDENGNEDAHEDDLTSGVLKRFKELYPALSTTASEIWEHFNEDRAPQLDLTLNAVCGAIRWSYENRGTQIGRLAPPDATLRHMQREKRSEGTSLCESTTVFATWEYGQSGCASITETIEMACPTAIMEKARRANSFEAQYGFRICATAKDIPDEAFAAVRHTLFSGQGWVRE